MKKHKLIQVVFKKTPNKSYLFMTEDLDIVDKDIVLCDVTNKGTQLGIVVDSDADVSLFNNTEVTKPIKKASFSLKPDVEVSESNNDFLKAYCYLNDVLPYELVSAYEIYKTF